MPPRIEEMDLPALDAAIAELEARVAAMRRRRRGLLLAQANEARSLATAKSDERIMNIYWTSGADRYGALTAAAEQANLSVDQVSRIVRRNRAWLKRKRDETWEASYRR